MTDEPVVQVGEHVRITTRRYPGALTPVAQVAPYCGRCNVGWPCPQAAMELEREPQQS